MRPIKFRAWSPYLKRMLHEGNKELDYYALTFNGRIVTAADTDLVYADGAEADLELMQFTGLLDKNRKEIYEGDILVFGRTEIHPGNGNFKVYWHTEKAMFHVERFPKEKFMTPDLRQENCTHYEVIGNIYQNPELLQS